ncbi:MAG: hypothetical protein IT228_08540 [Flavobacteriales bacterium]|nr:hypothetical protein [Flavobacteriales bacterium]MCC6577376.1 hypothetical protein [Flavobacteriales bacterium]NUQ15870.1 hypothetical protein [Flavobacteriales bacterium]
MRQRSTRPATPLFRAGLLGMLLTALLDVHAQIGINNTGAVPSPNALLDLNQVGRAFMAPRMTDAQRIALATAEGLMVFQNNSTPTAPKGYWYYDTDLLPVAGWVFVSDIAAWQLGGNTGTNAATDFVGTIDNVDLAFRTNGVERMRITGGALSTGGLVGINVPATYTEQLEVNGALLVGGTSVTNTEGSIRLNATTNAHDGNIDNSATWYQLENAFLLEKNRVYLSNPVPACAYPAGFPASGPTIDNSSFANTTINTTIETPYSRFWEDGRHQYLYLASDLAALNLCPNTNITGAAFSATSGGGQAITNTQLSMKNTPLAALATLDVGGGWVVCHTAASFTPAAGWNAHNFNVSPFQWNGASNLLVEFCFDLNTWTSNVGVNGETTNYTALYGIYCDACGHLFTPGSGTCYFASCPTTGPQNTPGVLCTGYGHTPGCQLLPTSSLTTCDGTFQYIGQTGSASRRPLLRLNAMVNSIVPVLTQGDFIYSPTAVMVEKTPGWATSGVSPNQKFKGPGTLGAEIGVWGGSLLLSDHVFDTYYDGKARAEDGARGAGYSLMPIEAMVNYVERERHLPSIPGRSDWQMQGPFSLDDLNTRLWVTVEEQALYIKELNERMNLLRQHLLRTRLATPAPGAQAR